MCHLKILGVLPAYDEKVTMVNQTKRSIMSDELNPRVVVTLKSRSRNYI